MKVLHPIRYCLQAAILIPGFLMERISMGHDIYPAVAAEIHKHSWNGIVEKICAAAGIPHYKKLETFYNH